MVVYIYIQNILKKWKKQSKMPKLIDKFYHEGAPPIYTIECNYCKKQYRILENQKFMCFCEKDEICIVENI